MKSVVFIPFAIRQWEMYLPLVGPLTKGGADVRFLAIDGFHYGEQIPQKYLIKGLNILSIKLSRDYLPRSKVEYFQTIYRELMPEWKRFLRKIPKGIVVSCDHGTLHRLMLNSAAELGFKKVTMQDGHYNSIPQDYGWELENKRRRLLKRIILRTPFERFINRSFGAAADFCGVYGNVTKDRFCSKAGFLPEKLTVIGSPRCAAFRERVKKHSICKNEYGFKILCLPTMFHLYHDKKLIEAQDAALKWLLESCVYLAEQIDRPILIDFKVKGGYDYEIDRYQKLLGHPMVNFLSGATSLETLFANSDLVITTGSTSALEAAVCNIPVIQIAPPYLHHNFTYISGLPLAKSRHELQDLIQKATEDRNEFTKKLCQSTKEEMADINPGWDSIEKTTNWLLTILNSV
jgi:hypothetical protein